MTGPTVVALVSCGKEKKNQRPEARHVELPARDLYTSALFRYSLRFAEKMADLVFILSAKHGLVPLEQPLRYYEESLVGKSPRARQKWAEGVIATLERRGLRPDGKTRFVLFAGSEYAEFLAPLQAEEPLAGLGLGYRLSWLKERVEESDPYRLI